MIRRPPVSTRTDTHCPTTTLVRSAVEMPRDLARSHALRDRGVVQPRAVQVQSEPVAVAQRACLREIIQWQRPALPGVFQAQQPGAGERSEEHTSELQSLMRISYAGFRLQKKTQRRQQNTTNH